MQLPPPVVRSCFCSQTAWSQWSSLVVGPSDAADAALCTAAAANPPTDREATDQKQAASSSSALPRVEDRAEERVS